MMYYQNYYPSAIFENKEDLRAFGKALEFNINEIILNRSNEVMILKNDLSTRYVLDWICEVNRLLNTINENKVC